MIRPKKPVAMPSRVTRAIRNAQNNMGGKLRITLRTLVIVALKTSAFSFSIIGADMTTSV